MLPVPFPRVNTQQGSTDRNPFFFISYNSAFRTSKRARSTIQFARVRCAEVVRWLADSCDIFKFFSTTMALCWGSWIFCLCTTLDGWSSNILINANFHQYLICQAINISILFVSTFYTYTFCLRVIGALERTLTPVTSSGIAVQNLLTRWRGNRRVWPALESEVQNLLKRWRGPWCLWPGSGISST